jgi:membrane fusion protein, multidrug efflux system
MTIPTIPNVDWNKAFEFAWRIVVFIVAVGIIIVVSTNWTRWEGGAGWQSTTDAYLQADLTPISAKVAGSPLSRWLAGEPVKQTLLTEEQTC